MIHGVHTMFYSSKPDELRAFIRDKLRFPFTDVGEGWLIFDVPEADLGCHPADVEHGAPSGTPSISFYCDDIYKTVADLKGRGVEFTTDVVDQGFGLVTHFRVPGDFSVMLYQPKYAKRPKTPAAVRAKKPAKVRAAASRKTAMPSGRKLAKKKR